MLRLVAPLGALLALLAFLPACGHDGGPNDGTDTVRPVDAGGGGEDTGGGPGEDTGGGGPDVPVGADVSPSPDCHPACDLCQVCAESQRCVPRECPAETVCDLHTGACEPEGACPDGCGPCEACEDGQCVGQCDADACETCIAGACVGCDEGCYCDGAQCNCWGWPECWAPNDAGYCDASIVDALALAPAPDPASGAGGCCCDFTDDGVLDNQLAALLAELRDMVGVDLAGLNDSIAASLTDGSVLVLLEYAGLCPEGADTAYFDLNVYRGADTDDPPDPTDDFSGSEELRVRAEWLTDWGDPIVSFEGARVLGGRLHSGPTQVLVPVSIDHPPLDLALTVDSATLDAEIAWDEGYRLADGRLCGYVTVAQVFDALNQFAAGSCDCLGLEGDLIEGVESGAFACGASHPACDPAAPGTGSVQDLCGTLESSCDTVLPVLSAFLDVDTDSDGTGDAISLGATFGATSAVLVGAAPAE